MTALVLIAALVLTPEVAPQNVGSICVARLPAVNSNAEDFTLFCRSRMLTLSIDGRSPLRMSNTEEQKVTELDLVSKHRVVVYCDGKAQQSFSFRFGAFKSHALCLFMNDLYQTVQLWEKSRSPWCNRR